MTGADDRGVEVRDGLVHRPVQPWTSTVHRLLVHLHDRLPDLVPRPVGIDGGTETVTFLPGQAGADCWPHQAGEAGLVSAARLLRTVHDASRDHLPAPDATWGAPATTPADVVCHGDPGPWNMAWRNGRAAGLFDWDFAHPGPAIDDVAYALEHLVPFRSDEQAVRWHGFTAPPDRPRRLRRFLQAYGWDEPPAVQVLVDAVIARQQRTIDAVAELARRGVQPQQRWVREGHLEELAERIRWSQTHRHLLDP
ncbi:aminoglycoside phosphotransferase family protein [Kineococcus rhizosphaerae]|uniref:aminoglycoside phosphotransferase family protein n=1 Tax=Kineococcus rhizosphaerae TaxID=559628 RepID=UPI000D0856BA|nr:aminoglycoside phosphotransferase family protein [Kineococcus rhizosphaerae]